MTIAQVRTELLEAFRAALPDWVNIPDHSVGVGKSSRAGAALYIDDIMPGVDDDTDIWRAELRLEIPLSPSVPAAYETLDQLVELVDDAMPIRWLKLNDWSTTRASSEAVALLRTTCTAVGHRGAPLEPAGPFNPIDPRWGTPLHRGWAADPSWNNPDPGEPVTSWRNDGSNGNWPIEGTGGAPVFSADAANGHPSISFNADGWLRIASELTNPVTTPRTLVIVCSTRDIGSNNKFIDGVSGRGIVFNDVDPWNVRSVPGPNLEADIPVTSGLHLLIATVSHTAVVRIDGVERAAGDNWTETSDLIGLTIGTRDNGIDGDRLDGEIPYYAIYPTDVLTENWFNEFEAGMLGHYEIDQPSLAST